MYFAIGVEPTKLTAAIPGWCRIASTASLSPCTTWNTPSGTPASCSSSARIRAAEGTFSDTLRMKQLPQARATGNIHNGTMAGKLNGVIPATTPKGWRRLWLSTRVPTFSVTSPFKSCGARGRELDHLEPAPDLAQRIGIDLAVLGGDRRGKPALVLLEQPQEPVEQPRPAQGRGQRPLGKRRPCAPHRRVDLGRPRQCHLARLLAGRRIVDRPEPPARPGGQLPADEMLNPSRHGASSRACGFRRVRGRAWRPCRPGSRGPSWHR